MRRDELAELIRNGESSGVDFKRDDIRPEKLAKEMAALLNLEGGHVLLGVEDDGSVSGLTRAVEKAEEWVMEVARTHVRPPIIPFWETTSWDGDKTVGVVTLPADAPDKPYKMKRASAWVTQVRVGTTSRDASDEEEARLYMQSGRLPYDRKPVPGATLRDLDRRRLANYFRSFRGQDCPDVSDDDGWSLLLVNTELMAEDRGRAVPSVGGLLLFGERPNKFLPHAGISATAYPRRDKDYAAKERTNLRGPLVSLFPVRPDARFEPAIAMVRTFSEPPAVEEAGVIEQAMDFVRRNIAVEAEVEGGQRQEHWDYPLDAVREGVVNAVAHRDYTIAGIDVDVSIYSDRIEIISPGRLPNTVTVEKMRAGYRASRNELVKEVLRDYRYIEGTGLGVPRKIVQGMRVHNGTDPDLIEEETRFVVRLWKGPKGGD
ncbi:MAG: ATP-dependent DNA helicase RecG [Planctomycetota bacterium]|nr:MAG: ATP-dependent DNA helicase RecG [Planctomycetota bacterium]